MKKSKKLLSLALAVALVASFNWSYFAQLLVLTKDAAIECVTGGSSAGTALAAELQDITVSNFFNFSADDSTTGIWEYVENDDNENEDTGRFNFDANTEEKSEGGRYSGDLIKVNKPDPAADALAVRIGGESRVRFANDPDRREFDVVSDEYIAQTKPALKDYGKSWRNQTKATFEAAQQTGKKAYFHFEGQPNESIIRKIQEYGDRYGVEYIVDTIPLENND